MKKLFQIANIVILDLRQIVAYKQPSIKLSKIFLNQPISNLT